MHGLQQFGDARCLRHGRKEAVLRSGGDACVLLAIAVARHSRRFHDLAQSLSELCTAHAWVRVALNLFDIKQESAAESRASQGLHTCVAVSAIAAFKTRFWQQVLVPSELLVTHVFLVDSDMDIRPTAFDLVTLLRLGEATNQSIISPAPYGGGNGFYHLDAPRLNNNYLLTKSVCGAEPSQWALRCAVCRQAVVEVKAPLFTFAAWRVVHERVLSRMPADALVGTPEVIDLMWCQLVGHLLDGCNPRDVKGLPFGANNCIGRTSCAYSYITPIRHLDDGEIQQRNQYMGMGAISSAELWLNHHAEKSVYSMMPSWRPKGSFLRREPCWGTDALTDALVNWTVPAREPDVVLRAEKSRKPHVVMRANRTDGGAPHGRGRGPRTASTLRGGDSRVYM